MYILDFLNKLTFKIFLMESSKLFHSLGPMIDKQKDFLSVLTFNL